MDKKICLKYYFSVEGQTEKWYLEWLQKQINDNEKANCKVKFDIQVQKNPIKRVKSLNVLNKTDIIHVFDFEDLQNELAFQKTLSYMKEASTKKKNVRYLLGYCNYDFELWMILHKKCDVSYKEHRSKYLSVLNAYFNEKFETMSQYKEEDNFKKVLNKLTLNDVKYAIQNAEKITKNNQENQIKVHFAKYTYYKNNPSLNLHEHIRKILEDTSLI